MKFSSVLSLATLLFFSFTYNSFSQVTIDAPAEVPAGADFKVGWTGPNNKQDFISIAEVGAEDRKYSTYVFTKRGEVLKFRAPDEAGDYELRYMDGATYSVLETKPITITETTASLEAHAEVAAGSEFKVPAHEM